MNDTIQVLIEGNAAGLETQLKKGMTLIQQFVSTANSQELDWQKILAGTLDTAIIGGIAASFAQAIEQAVAFQSSILNLNNNTNAAASATGGSINGISDAMVNLAGQTGSSLSDVANAYEALYKQFGSSDAATQLTGLIGQIAQESGQSLNTLMPQLITLFNQWGITTLPAATDALTGLVESAGEGKFSLNDLISTISDQGPLLQAKTNVNALAVQLQALSNIPTLSLSTIKEDLSAIATQTANPLSNISLFTGVAAAFNGPDGLINAFQKLSGFLQGQGGMAQYWGQQLGLSAGTVQADVNTTTAAYVGAEAQAKILAASQTPIGQFLAAHLSDMNKLQDAWALLVAELGKTVGVPVLEDITNYLNGISTLLAEPKLSNFFSDLASGFSSNVQTGLAHMTAGIGQTFTAAQSAPAGPANLANMAGGLIAAFGSFINAIAGSGGSSTGAPAPALVTNNTTGNTTSANMPTAATINVYAGGSSAAPAVTSSAHTSLGTSISNAAAGLLADVGL